MTDHSQIACTTPDGGDGKREEEIAESCSATPGSSRDHAGKPTSASSGQDTHLSQPAPRKALRPGKMAEEEKRQKMSDGVKKPLSSALIHATPGSSRVCTRKPPSATTHQEPQLPQPCPRKALRVGKMAERAKISPTPTPKHATPGSATPGKSRHCTEKPT